MTSISNSARYNYSNGSFVQSNSGSYIDAFKQWGISLDGTALSALMTPAPLKEMIENNVATEHGIRVVRTGRKMASRTVNINFNISANSTATFLSRYGNFCTNVLASGKIDLMTSFQAGVVYHLDYLSCQNFAEYRLGVGKFALRVIESNPNNRT